MPSNVQIHRQVPQNDAKISKETKTTVFRLLQKYDTKVSKSDKYIGQTDLIKMHAATRLDAAQLQLNHTPLL